MCTKKKVRSVQVHAITLIAKRKVIFKLSVVNYCILFPSQFISQGKKKMAMSDFFQYCAAIKPSILDI